MAPPFVVPAAFAVAAFTLTAAPETSLAQRGIGQPTGVARRDPQRHRPARPDPRLPQHHRSRLLGSHLTLQLAEDIAEAQSLEPGPTVNVHLGPTAATEDDIEGLTEGTRLEVELFRTDRMPDNHFVAATLRMLLLLPCPGFARSLRR